MESYGAILKNAREQKQLSLEAVERDTTITKQYILALENEEEANFPGEPYLIGFLRNYADYLGVSSAEVIKLYHAKKLQESPVPEGLIEKHKPRWLIPLIIVSVLVVCGGIGFGVYYIVKSVEAKRIEEAKLIEQNSRSHQYAVSVKGDTKRIFKGDQLLIATDEGKGNIVLTVKNTLKNLVLETPVGQQVIELSEERDLDIDGDGISDLIVYLSDISTISEDRGAEVRVIAKSGSGFAAPVVTELDDKEISSSAVQKNARQQLIIEDTRAYPFTVSATYRGACVFRYKVDRDDYIEDYFTSGDIVTVTANNSIRLWISNNNAVKIQIIANSSTYDLEVGKAGQIHVEDIRWVKEADGKYRLVVIELD